MPDLNKGRSLCGFYFLHLRAKLDNITKYVYTTVSLNNTNLLTNSVVNPLTNCLDTPYEIVSMKIVISNAISNH